MNSSHRVRVMGRELQVKSQATAESVREVEAYVNGKLAEVAASVKTNDAQIIAILTLMNITESYLSLAKENDAYRQQGCERISRLLCQLEINQG
ncbi:MAG TPA: cell division protein ZapA [Geobacteraceae bacterium]|nr:cell division protein ZapA [Geobacteraceae bacterium]